MALVLDAKRNFKEWLAEHLQNDEEYPDYMLYNGVQPGHHGDTKYGGQRHFHLPNVGKSVETLAKDLKLGKHMATKAGGAGLKLGGTGVRLATATASNLGQATLTSPGAKKLTNKVANVAPNDLKTVLNVGANLGKSSVKSGVGQGRKVGGAGLKIGGAVVKNAPVFSRAFRHGQNEVVSSIKAPNATADDKMVLVSASMGETDVQSELEAAMADTNKLIYAEYVLMVTGDLWMKYVNTDWHKLAWKMRLLRNCYDTADVEGTNALTLEMLEMVIFALDPDHGLTHKDIVYLWGILNPDGKPALTFDDYLHGMGNVTRDPKCHDWIDIARPNQWELLSLIIDTPHSEAEDERLLEGLSWLERHGILLLKTMRTPMEMEHMRDVLSKVGKGELRKLEPEQFRRMQAVHLECVLTCIATGFVFTALPALFENHLLVYPLLLNKPNALNRSKELYSFVLNCMVFRSH